MRSIGSTAALVRFVAAMVALGVTVGPARAEEDLGSYEREALREALRERDLEREPDPEGKILREIHVVNRPVFVEGDGAFLRWLNLFHWTTDEEAVRREVLLRPGQTWDRQLVAETERKLRNPLFSSLALLVPVKAPGRGQVDLLVVTRDVWSLRLNSKWELQAGTLTFLQVALAENNLFGWRKHVAMVFEMDQGTYAIGPQYNDANVLGRRLQLDVVTRLIFGRESSSLEGSRSKIIFGRPLWSLYDEWGWELSFRHDDSIERVFRGTELLTHDDPDTPEDEMLPHEFRRRSINVRASTTYQTGDDLKYHLIGGYRVDALDVSLREGFPGDTAERAWFRDEVMPRPELSSAPFVGYRLFTPEYAVYRDVDSFDLAEDVQLGPDITGEAALARELFGSDRDFVGLSTVGTWTLDLAGDGFVRFLGEFAARFQDGEFVDDLARAGVVTVAPRFGSWGRIAARVELGARFRETSNRFFTLGGESGLRGYEIGAFAGEARVVGNLELRSMPVPLSFLRVGALAFWDVGHAADSLEELSLRNDVGFGVRLLIPQLTSKLFRFDFAVPLQGPKGALYGRITAGLEQVF